MADEKRYQYEGNPDNRPKNAHPDSPQQLEPYVVADDLKRAVNLALFLRRPLLLEGESGCGKTRLAYAVAYELGLPLYRWPVTSNSKTQEGLYTYNAILRLHDVHTKESKHRNPENPQDYLELGPLGKAFDLKDHPGVVLIDEIDKADVDFPNDLLTILDDPWSFPIVETNETITATHKPILFITSNKEKGNLPAPFLRRCIYHFIKFPEDEELLKQIVASHYKKRNEKAPAAGLTGTAVSRFLDLRQETGLHKKPGTSEFLDWLHVLNAFEKKPFAERELAKDTAVPYRELLFKLRADWLRFTG
ncbi:MAG: MoxR family ATPase [Anaerolineales bacterium]|nr:MoxR family ATPase [Anaerolineales bacterium]